MNRNIRIARELVKLAKSLVASHVFCDEREYRSVREVREQYPSADKIVRVSGGWEVFGTASDYETWKSQK